MDPNEMNPEWSGIKYVQLNKYIDNPVQPPA